MIEKEQVNFIEGTPVAVRMYSIEEYEPHYHENCIELLLVLKGDAYLMASYDRFHMKAGEFIVINNGDIHYIRSDVENVLLSMYVDLDAFTDKCRYIRNLYFVCESFNVNNVQRAYLQELRKVITSIAMDAAGGGENTDRINESINQFMDMLIYRFDLANYHNLKEISEPQLERYHRLIREADENYGDKLDLEDIASKEFIGKKYISQFWKNMTNMNFTEFLNSRRSEKAEKILLTTDRSINEISLMCGFSDTKYIYKNFKKWYDKTPLAHKKEYEEYKQKGTSMREYSGDEFLGRFGREFIYASVDEEKADIIKSTEDAMSWRKKYEYEVRKSTGTKLKREMIRESRQASGLKSVYLPLLDSNVVKEENGDFFIDNRFIEKVLTSIRDLGMILYVEIEFNNHSIREWKRIIRSFAKTAAGKGGEDLLQNCRFIVYIDEFEKDMLVKELADGISDVINTKNIEMAMRFD